MRTVPFAAGARWLAAGALAVLCPPAGAQQLNARSSVGTNLSAATYWSSEWVFVDLFETAAPWWPQEVNGSTWDTGASLQLGPNGWPASLQPNQAAGTLLCRDIDGRYPKGRYLVLFEGEGELQIGFDGRTVSKAPGRYEIDVTPSNAGIHVKIVRTDPANPLRDVRVVQPRFAGRKSRFHPSFLARWSHCRVLRFMDWQRTNDSPVRRWSERTKPTWYTQDAPAGVALEHMIDLCNELGADPWFCIPHMASDDYVRRFATVVRDRLDPGLRAHVEYSNEVWNGMFAQSAWANQQGLALGLASSPWLAGMRYYARRSVEVFRIFEQVFGGTARLVRVLASQSANPWVGEQVMDWRNAAANADALAIAPYFGGALGDPATAAQVATWSVEQVLLAAFLDVGDVMTSQVAVNARNAADRGLPLIAYEGGQHLVGFGGAQNNRQLSALFHDANRHWWMGLIMRHYLQQWRRHGGTLFVAFNSTSEYSKWGSWGMLEYSDQAWYEAPKYWAFVDYWLRNPRWW